MAITRHGDTGTEAEQAALKEAASRLQETLAAEGISGEEIQTGFMRWRPWSPEISGRNGLVLDANILGTGENDLSR